MKTTTQATLTITQATVADAAEIHALQQLAYQSEAEVQQNHAIPPLLETLDDVEAAFGHGVVFKILVDSRIIASARTSIQDGTCHVSRVIVHPSVQNRGVGTRLMRAVEARFPDVRRFELFTSQKSRRNLHFYAKLGYEAYKTVVDGGRRTLVYLEKRLDRPV
ncbi:MAG: GNAT family N-acetyltransferase [Planctomycetia bacterium]|nr:GNAT family N-acetyltransferase [Planctomycetia bacterium]